MKNLLLLVLLSHTITSYSTLLPQEIKNTHSIFMPGFEQLSPLPGIVWAWGGVVENLAELYFDDTKSTVALVKKLFHRVDPATFIPTRAEYNAASYLDPTSMGKIAALLLSYKNIEEKYKDKALIEQKLSDVINAALKKPFAELNQKIAADPNNSKLLKLKRDLEKSAKQYPGLFVKALLESNENISFFKIIGAFVYYKSTDKARLHDYYVGIAEQLDPESVFNKPDFLTVGKQGWVSDTFKPEDKILNMSGDLPLEQLVFTVKEGADPNQWLIPYLTEYTTAYPPSIKDSGFGFPNCVENALKNFYVALFAKKDGTIDVSLVEKVSPDSKILEFFKKIMPKSDGVINFSKLADLRSKEATDAFAEMASNIKDIGKADKVYFNRDDYLNVKRPQDFRCELNADLGTVNRVMQALNGSDFDSLVQAVNKNTQNNFAISKNTDDKGVLTITIYTNDRGLFTWKLSSDHAIFKEIPTNKQLHFIEVLQKKAQPVRDVLALLPLSPEKVVPKNIDSYEILLNKLHGDDELLIFQRLTLDKSINFTGLWNRIQSEDAHNRAFNIALERPNKTLELIKMLISHKPPLTDWKGSTVLYLLAEAPLFKEFPDYGEAAQLLLSHMSLQSILLEDKFYKETALQRATQRKNWPVLNQIIKRLLEEKYSFKGFDFARMHLRDINFSGQDLSQARFIYAELDNVNLKGAVLDDVSFGGSTLKNMDLSEVKIKPEQLESVTLCDVELPRAWKKKVSRAGECTLF